jgi:hypothetical protein
MEKSDILKAMQKFIDDDREFRKKNPHYGKKIVEVDGQFYAYDPKEFEYKVRGPTDYGR